MIVCVLLALVCFLSAVNCQCSSECASRVEKLDKEMAKLKTRFENRGASGYGAIYTRWGRKTCPGDSSLMYEGVAGGSHYSHQGGGANYLCLPKEPQFANVNPGAQGCGGYIYGAEYEVCSQDFFSKENTLVSSFQNQNVPCAVCQATKRQSHMFIPAKTECPSGWNKEYEGFVMGANLGHQRAEWVCVDKAPEARSHGETNEDGALFYFAEIKTGVLPGPPYQDGSIVPCVVCTQ